MKHTFQDIENVRHCMAKGCKFYLNCLCESETYRWIKEKIQNTPRQAPGRQATPPPIQEVSDMPTKATVIENPAKDLTLTALENCFA